MTENEHFTGVSVTEKPQRRDWLAALAFICLGLVGLGQIGAAAVDFQAARLRAQQSEQMCRQLALTARLTQLLVDKYDPDHKGVHHSDYPPDEWGSEKLISRPVVDPSESPFPELPE